LKNAEYINISNKAKNLEDAVKLLDNLDSSNQKTKVLTLEKINKYEGN
jgi:hypothetical protein